MQKIKIQILIRVTFSVCLLLLMQNFIYAQNWQQNDLIFNPSGIPSLPFSQPRFADLDSDGDLDMLLGSLDQALLYFENFGSATSPSFQAIDTVFSEVAYLDAEMGVCVDLDADGDLDLICGGYNGLNLYKNIGSATLPQFEKVENIFAGLNVGANPVPTFADVDADNDFDLLVGLSESGVMKFFPNSGRSDSAVFHGSDAESWSDVGLYAYPWFDDLDVDGDFDLLAGRDVSCFSFFRNTGTANQFQWQSDNAVFSGIAATTYWNSPCLVDLNGDGKSDLIYGTSAGPLNYFINNGTALNPVWTANTSLFGGVLDVGGASSPCLYDFDGDGDLDLISGSQLGDLKYYRNIGTAVGPAWQEAYSIFSGIDHSIYSSVTVGDVNNDTLPDVVVGDLSGQFFLHLNTGSGFSYISSAFSGIDLGYTSVPRLIDMDSDGDLDLVAGNEDGNLFYFENVGSPESASWTEISDFFGNIDVGSNCVPAPVDFDSDGDIDIFTGDLFHEIQYFENDEATWVEKPEIIAGLTAGQNAAPAFGDLDNDGDPDLVIGNYSGTFNYYENVNPVAIQPDQPGFTLEDFCLDNAYPNPFNSTVIICGMIPESGFLKITVYNILGQQLFTRQLQKAPAGDFSFPIVWPSVYPAGHYFYHVEYKSGAGVQRRMGKIVYLK